MYGSFRFPGDLFPELSQLQQRLDEVFQSNGGATNIRAFARGGFPAVNVGSSPESIEVVVFAPGVDRSALQITVDRGLLIISGERKPAARDDGEQTVYAQERFAGSFRRVISLSEDADPGKVDATLRDGVLHVSIAKRESSKPRQITVN